MTLKPLLIFLLPFALCAAQTAQPVQGTPAKPDNSKVCPTDISIAAPPDCVPAPVANEKGATPAEIVPPRAETPVTSSRVVGPITSRSEFELFAEDAAGHPLNVYGRQLFDQVPTTFAPVDRIPVPANYVVGPGDELLIQIWGKIDLNSHVTVDRNGQIFLPKVGSMSVAGLRYEQLDSYLRTAVGGLYKGFELNVTMGQLRSIQVFVLGSARQPGAYTVSSLSTLVDALFTSGGPSATGSMRHIQLRRAGQLVTEFDVYDLLRNGDKSHDVPLLPGDVIFIPPVGFEVAIMGSVNEPGIYELKDESTIASELKDAGGLTNMAGMDRVLLERIESHRRRRVDEFPLDPSELQRVLKDGDMLRIFPISPQIENAVTLRGNVAQPGRFTWHEGMRISDLIPSRETLVTSGYWDRQNHLAGNAHIDMLTDIDENSSEIDWDYAAIQRLDDRDLSTRLIAFNLGNALDNPASSDNQVLRAGDVITIFSRKDLPLPMEKQATFVRIGGEVNAPGVYRVNPGETLRSVVERAGGLTSHSYLYASQLTRVSTRQAQEEQLRLSIAQMQKELISRYAATPSLGSAGAADQQTQMSAQQAVIAQLSQVHPIGRIVLGMKPLADTVADIPNISLEDGDSYYIPPRLSTVQVTGAVYNESAFRYEQGKRVLAYLRDAGGPSRQADTKRVFLIRADGTVVSSQSHSMFWRGNFQSLALLPGDAIVVPTKLKSPGGFTQQLPFIAQMLSQMAMTGAVLGTIQ